MAVNFPNGLAIGDLAAHLTEVAQELDGQRAARRTGADVRKDQRIGPSEVQWGLDHLELFDPKSEAPKIAELGQLFGLVAAPVKVTKTWEERPSHDKLREPVRTVVAGDRIYVQDAADKRAVPYYDSSSDTWGTVPLPLKEASYQDFERGTFGAVGDTLVYAAGHSGWQAAPWLFTKKAGAAEWTFVSGFEKRADATMAEAQGKLYIFGGEGDRTTGAAQPLATGQIFDPATNTLTSMPAMPVARLGASAITLGDKIYVVGGQVEKGQYTNRVDIFDVTTQQWSQDPLFLETAVLKPSLWIEDGKIHVSGGESTASRQAGWTSNSAHEVIDPASAKVSSAGTMPNAQYDEAVYGQVNGRLFLFGREPTYHSAKGAQHTRELVVKQEAAPQPPAGPTYNVTNIYDTDIGISIHNVQNTAVVSHVEHNHLTVNAVSIHHQELNQELTLLPFAKLGANIGFFDGDFFLRTQAGSKPLLRCDTDDQGQRHFIGQKAQGKSPAPKNASLAMYLPSEQGQGQLIPFQTDKNGEFRVPLPQGAQGQAYVFGLDGGQPSAAAVIELP